MPQIAVFHARAQVYCNVYRSPFFYHWVTTTSPHTSKTEAKTLSNVEVWLPGKLEPQYLSVSKTCKGWQQGCHGHQQPILKCCTSVLIPKGWGSDQKSFCPVASFCSRQRHLNGTRQSFWYLHACLQSVSSCSPFLLAPLWPQFHYCCHRNHLQLIIGYVHVYIKMEGWYNGIFLCHLFILFRQLCMINGIHWGSRIFVNW